MSTGDNFRHEEDASNEVTNEYDHNLAPNVPLTDVKHHDGCRRYTVAQYCVVESHYLVPGKVDSA